MVRLAGLVLLSLALVACEGGLSPGASEDDGDDTVDAGADAGGLDAGGESMDAGPLPDAGEERDAGPMADAGPKDAGESDAGTKDGGLQPPDAGPRDAGTPDAGPPKPTFVLHARSQWEDPANPVTSTSLMAVGSLEYLTVHYNGDVLDLDGADNVYQDQDFVTILRNIQTAYVRDRGYSIGYNSAIAPNGDEWVLRGFDFRTAANGCVAANVPGYAILIPVPTPTSAPTATQVAGLKAAIARVRAVIASKGNTRTIVINGHNFIRTVKCGSGTGCPGPYFEALIDAGSLEP
ncbi:MAG: hypothetical protein K1X89_09940 [Myxococcaceae bacterium]|nr:hypothetical protein [Myxococcaceae bacterium]